MAQSTVPDLLSSPGVERVGIAGRNASKAEAFAASQRDDRATSVSVDARDSADLVRELKRWDCVINSTWYDLNVPITEAAIAAGIHYCDLGGLYHQTLRQLKLDTRARDAGVTCVLGIGSTPGTMNVMGVHGASKLDKVSKVQLRSSGAVVAGGEPGKFVPPYAIRTIFDEFSLDAPILRKGKIRFVPALSGLERSEFMPPVGVVEGYYTIHSELATMPKTIAKGVREMDFIVAFPPPFRETVATLVRLGLASREEIVVEGTKVRPYDVTSSVIDGLPKPREPELDVDIIKLDRCSLFFVQPGFFTNIRERFVDDFKGPFDVLISLLSADELALASIWDAEEDVVPEAVDEPVPPSPRVRTQRVPEVSDLVFRREVDVPDGPDVLDPGRDAAVVREILKPTVELPTEAVDVIVVFRMLSEDLEPLEARGDADRMAVVRPRVERGVLPAAARFEDVHDLGLAPEACELEPAAGDLAERRHVRADVVVLLCASVGEAEAGKDLVEDQDDALLPRELSQALEVIGLGRNDPGAAEHGLDDQGADLVLVLFEDRRGGLDVVVREDHDQVGDGLRDPTAVRDSAVAVHATRGAAVHVEALQHVVVGSVVRPFGFRDLVAARVRPRSSKRMHRRLGAAGAQPHFLHRRHGLPHCLDAVDLESARHPEHRFGLELLG